MIDWSHTIDAFWTGLVATSPLEALSVVLGLAYAVFAIRKSRWCWVTGGLSSAILIYRNFEIPFGVFLGTATLFSAFWGTALVRWYVHTAGLDKLH